MREAYNKRKLGRQNPIFSKLSKKSKSVFFFQNRKHFQNKKIYINRFFENQKKNPNRKQKSNIFENRNLKVEIFKSENRKF